MTAITQRVTPALRDAASRYGTARRSLATPGSWQSRAGLDWMNFFIADVQTGFGTFVAFYLAGLGWSQQSIGIALAVDGLAGVVSQIPGGALADAVSWKRGLTAVGILMIGAAALVLAFVPSVVMVFVAELLHGLTAGILTPAIGAISLGLVGRSAMSLRTGRNIRYAAAGGALTAALMGVAGTYLWQSAVFVTAALLCVPALVALSFIRPDEIDYARARNAAKDEHGIKVESIFTLARNRTLLLFAGCLVLFQLADASMLPLIGESLAKQAGASTLQMSVLILVPQIVVAMLAPWVGYHSEARGRRPLLLIGFAIEPVRAILLALSANYGVILAAQVLDGITGAIVTVLTVLVVTDLTAGSGRFNLGRGVVGTLSAIAASLSTALTGFAVQHFGQAAAFALIALIAGAATALLWVFQSETKPAKYDDD